MTWFPDGAASQSVTGGVAVDLVSGRRSLLRGALRLTENTVGLPSLCSVLFARSPRTIEALSSANGHRTCKDRSPPYRFRFKCLNKSIDINAVGRDGCSCSAVLIDRKKRNIGIGFRRCEDLHELLDFLRRRSKANANKFCAVSYST